MFRLKPLISRNVCSIVANNVYRMPFGGLKKGRNLCSLAFLQIPKFLEIRQNYLKDPTETKKFKTKMRDMFTKDGEFRVFADDLKKMIKISETDEDLEILQIMLKKYYQHSNSFLFQTFKFGPEVMRLYYVLNKPLDVISLIGDQDLCNMFDHNICYLILMDMLFENKYYNEVLTIFETKVENRDVKSLILLYLAACYKLNTPEAYEKAIVMWRSNPLKDFKTNRRPVMFLSMLAFNQNDNCVAINILSHLSTSVFESSLKSMALARESRFVDVLEGLSEKLNFFSKLNDRTSSHKVLTIDAIPKLEEEFQKDKPSYEKFEIIKNKLKENNLISEKTLEDILLAEVDFKQPSVKTRQRKISLKKEKDSIAETI